MSHYAILRIAKYKTAQNLASSLKHCIKKNIGYRYYYLPNVNKELAKKRRFPSFTFSCDTELNCRVIQIISSEPYNIGVSIHFNHPKYIFIILDYIDQHFYNILGVHLW